MHGATIKIKKKDNILFSSKELSRTPYNKNRNYAWRVAQCSVSYCEAITVKSL